MSVLFTNSHFTIRKAETSDFYKILHLNQASVSVLSPLDLKRLEILSQNAEILWVVCDNRIKLTNSSSDNSNGSVVAFLLGFTANADYESTNYQWFNKRLKSFFYVDRIVIAEGARSEGLGQWFYQSLTDWCQKEELLWICAEVDSDPPNEQSLRFHFKQKFSVLAKQRYGSPIKEVTLLARSI